jgi:hypothetical protein
MKSGDQQERFLKGVAKVTGISKGIIDQVYKRGLAAWAVGHRPGATQSQWARARVYSFLQKGGAVTKGPQILSFGHSSSSHWFKDKLSVNISSKNINHCCTLLFYAILEMIQQGTVAPVTAEQPEALS